MHLEWFVELRVASSSLGVREVCDGGLKWNALDGLCMHGLLDRNIARRRVFFQIVVDRAFGDIPAVDVAACDWFELREQRSGSRHDCWVTQAHPGDAKRCSWWAARLRTLFILAIRLLTSFRGVPFGHALWADGIHKARSWLRSVMCAQKPRVRFETTSSAVALSRRPFRKWPMGLRFSRLAALTWPRLSFPRMGRLTGDASSNSRWSLPFQVGDIVLLYAFLRAASKNGTSFKTACAGSMFQR